jgi:hypothetical protein
MSNHKSSCPRYPEFHGFEDDDFAPDTERTFAGEFTGDDYDDNTGWHIEDFDLEHFAVDEDPTTPTGHLEHRQDRFFESPANVLLLIKQQQHKMADFFITLDSASQGSPQKQIEMIRSQIALCQKNLDDLKLRLDIAREIHGLRGLFQGQLKKRQKRT